MTHRSILSRLALTSVAVALLATAPASAMPTEPAGVSADEWRQDMHASTVQAPDKADRTVQDARGEAAAGGGTGSTVPAPKPTLQGPPTWPVYPTPLPRPAQQPIATDGGGDDIGLDLPVALLILAGALAVGGGMAVAVIKGRTPTRVAH